MISGSFDVLAQRANLELGGFDAILAECKLLFNRDGRLESWDLKGTDCEDKARYVQKVSKRFGVPLERCAYVGDDANDIDAFEKVGLAIAVPLCSMLGTIETLIIVVCTPYVLSSSRQYMLAA